MASARLAFQLELRASDHYLVRRKCHQYRCNV